MHNKVKKEKEEYGNVQIACYNLPILYIHIIMFSIIVVTGLTLIVTRIWYL